MRPSIRQRLEQLADRLAELDALLGTEQAVRDMENFRRLNRERAEIAVVVDLFFAYRKAEADLAAAVAMESDPEMRDFAREEAQAAREINREYDVPDAVEDLLRKHFTLDPERVDKWTCTADILTTLQSNGLGMNARANAMHLGATLKRLGHEKRRVGQAQGYR